MNRIFKIAGEFLESVDQRADRSVNCMSILWIFIFVATTSSQPFKPRYTIDRNIENRIPDTSSQAAATDAISSRIRDRYTSLNVLLMLKC